MDCSTNQRTDNTLRYSPVGAWHGQSKSLLAVVVSAAGVLTVVLLWQSRVEPRFRQPYQNYK